MTREIYILSDIIMEHQIAIGYRMICNSYLQPSASTVTVTILTDVAAISGKSLDLAQLVEHTTVTEC